MRPPPLVPKEAPLLRSPPLVPPVRLWREGGKGGRGGGGGGGGEPCGVFSLFLLFLAASLQGRRRKTVG